MSDTLTDRIKALDAIHSRMHNGDGLYGRHEIQTLFDEIHDISWQRITGFRRDCVFCDILAAPSESKVQFVDEWEDAVAIVPLKPVVEGHVMVIPRMHVADFTEDPLVTAKVMMRAAELARGCSDFNLITSKGSKATQTVFHLHVHLVPRKWEDGLRLPWHNEEADAKIWDEGKAAGMSRAMRKMSDEPNLSLDIPNPYRL